VDGTVRRLLSISRSEVLSFVGPCDCGKNRCESDVVRQVLVVPTEQGK